MRLRESITSTDSRSLKRRNPVGQIFMTKGSNLFHVAPAYQPLMRMIGLDAEAVFDHPEIHPWRRLPDRENCTLDADLPVRHVRLHVKRYAPVSGQTPAEVEVRGHQFLLDRHIPTADLVGWGQVADGRSFVIFDDQQHFIGA